MIDITKFDWAHSQGTFWKTPSEIVRLEYIAENYIFPKEDWFIYFISLKHKILLGCSIAKLNILDFTLITDEIDIGLYNLAFFDIPFSKRKMPSKLIDGYSKNI